MTEDQKHRLLEEAIALHAVEGQDLTAEQIAFFRACIDQNKTDPEIAAAVDARHASYEPLAAE